MDGERERSDGGDGMGEADRRTVPRLPRGVRSRRVPVPGPGSGRRRRVMPAPLSDLHYLILGYVGAQPAGIHGYRLGRRLASSPLGLPAMRLGQLYRILHDLGRRGLVGRRIEADAIRPARLVFSITRAGQASFERWLGGPPRGAIPVREQLLQRLRFADAVPEAVLRRFVRDAQRECTAELAALRVASCPPGNADDDPIRPGGARPFMLMALERRLHADRAWLADMERLVDAAVDRDPPSAVIPSAGNGLASTPPSH